MSYPAASKCDRKRSDQSLVRELLKHWGDNPPTESDVIRHPKFTSYMMFKNPDSDVVISSYFGNNDIGIPVMPLKLKIRIGYYRFDAIDCDSKKITSVSLHRFKWEIFNGPIPNGLVIDHINGDRLDNRLSDIEEDNNLRLVNNSHNSHNIKVKMSGCSSKFVGVYWDKPRNKWRVASQITGKNHFIGRFDTEEEAAHAYDNYCVMHGYFPMNKKMNLFIDKESKEVLK